MNQFKKAKQRAEETGHATEKITDLKTAGVSSNATSNKILTDDAPQSSLEKVHSAPNDSTQTINESDEIIQNASSTKIVNPPERLNTDLYIKASDASNDTINDISTDNVNSNTYGNINNNTNNGTDNSTGNTNNNFGNTINPIPVKDEKTSLNSDSANNSNIPSNTINPIINNNAYLPNPSAANIIESQGNTLPPVLSPKPEYASMPIPLPTVIQEEKAAIAEAHIVKEPEYAYTPKPASKSSSKKNIPNIFAPKGEAKSMRKSLVLKPTSVKIAENYCAKNGGSFNELIQTLLDNFIEEYGL